MILSLFLTDCEISVNLLARPRQGEARCVLNTGLL
jgi:hypothetical protein